MGRGGGLPRWHTGGRVDPPPPGWGVSDPTPVQMGAVREGCRPPTTHPKKVSTLHVQPGGGLGLWRGGGPGQVVGDGVRREGAEMGQRHGRHIQGQAPRRGGTGGQSHPPSEPTACRHTMSRQGRGQMEWCLGVLPPTNLERVVRPQETIGFGKKHQRSKKSHLYTSGCPLGVRSGLDAADEAGADALRPPGEAVLRRGRHGRGALLWLGVSANVGWGREEGRRLSTFFVFVVWVGWVGGQGHHPPLTRGRKHHLPSDKPPKY